MRLCKEIRKMIIPINHSEQALSVTISVGIAQFRKGVDTWDTLLSRADTAMYKAKNNGRDRWSTAD